MRRHIAKTHKSTWARRGYLPEETLYLSEISRAGARAPYIRAMTRHRIALNANRVRYGWSVEEYRRRIIKDYEKLGLPKFVGGSYKQYLKRNFYDILTEFKDRTPYDPEWQTPRRKKMIRIKGEPKAQTSRRKMLYQQLEDNASKQRRVIASNDQRELRQLQKQRDGIQRKIDNLR